LTGRSVSDLLELAAGVPPGAGGVGALPYLEGERAPRWNRELRAELVGLSMATGPAELARALLEAAAYGLAHIACELAGAAGTAASSPWATPPWPASRPPDWSRPCPTP